MLKIIIQISFLSCFWSFNIQAQVGFKIITLEGEVYSKKKNAYLELKDQISINDRLTVSNGGIGIIDISGASYEFVEDTIINLTKLNTNKKVYPSNFWNETDRLFQTEMMFQIIDFSFNIKLLPDRNQDLKLNHNSVLCLYWLDGQEGEKYQIEIYDKFDDVVLDTTVVGRQFTLSTSLLKAPINDLYIIEIINFKTKSKSRRKSILVDNDVEEVKDCNEKLTSIELLEFAIEYEMRNLLDDAQFYYQKAMNESHEIFKDDYEMYYKNFLERHKR